MTIVGIVLQGQQPVRRGKRYYQGPRANSNSRLCFTCFKDTKQCHAEKKPGCEEKLVQPQFAGLVAKSWAQSVGRKELFQEEFDSVGPEKSQDKTRREVGGGGNQLDGFVNTGAGIGSCSGLTEDRIGDEMFQMA